MLPWNEHIGPPYPRRIQGGALWKCRPQLLASIFMRIIFISHQFVDGSLQLKHAGWNSMGDSSDLSVKWLSPSFFQEPFGRDTVRVGCSFAV